MRGLDHQRIADRVGPRAAAARATGPRRCSPAPPARRRLVSAPSRRPCCPSWCIEPAGRADEHDAGGLHRVGEVRVLGQSRNPDGICGAARSAASRWRRRAGSSPGRAPPMQWFVGPVHAAHRRRHRNTPRPVRMPSRRQVRITRRAISPRLAMSFREHRWAIDCGLLVEGGRASYQPSATP